MEVFTRMILRKYFKGKVVETEMAAIIEGFETSIQPAFIKFDCHEWRKDVLWKEENDIIYKRYMPAFKKIYEKHSGRLALPGAKKFVCMDEFYEMINDTGVVSDSFGQREIGVIYTMSMMTQVDEINK